MGRLPWACKEELTWMLGTVAGFHEAQAKGGTTNYSTTVQQDFFDEFWKDPTTGVTKTEVVDYRGRTITMAQRRAGTKQISNWLWNHRAGKDSQQEKGVELNLMPKKAGKRQLYQVYMNMHKKRIMPLIRQEYADYLKNTPTEDAVDGWKFACARAREMLEEETDEVRKEVAEEHEQNADGPLGLDDFMESSETWDKILKEKASGDMHKHARRIQEIIDCLPKVLANVAERVEEQSGWKISILVGGPSPETGALSAFFLHQGRTVNLGNTFPEASGKWPEIQQVFNKFLVIKRLHDAYKEGPTEPNPSEAPAASTSTAKAADSVESDHDSTPEMDYEELREETIRQRKALMKELGLDTPFLSTPAEPTKKPRKPRKKKTDNPAPSQRTLRSKRTSAAADLETPTSNVPSSSPSTTPSPSVPAGVTPTAIAPSEAQAQASASQTTPSTETASTTGSTQAASSAADIAQAAGSGSSTTDAPQAPSSETTSATATSTPATTPATTTGAAPPDTVKEATSRSLAPPANPPPSTHPGRTTSDARVAPDDSSSPSAPVVAATDVRVASSEVAAVSNPPELAVPGPGSPVPSVPMSVGTVATIKDGAPSALFGSCGGDQPEVRQTGVEAPDWINEALRYFALVDGGSRWKQLVDEWTEFEKLLGYPNGQESQNRLAAEHRPEEVKLWMKNHRQYEKLPKIKSSAQFAVAWKGWWISLQPASRTVEGTWPLPRKETFGGGDSEEWNAVCRGGCNGFFLVILSLAWWVCAVRSEGEVLDDVLMAVDDVSWVCRTACENARKVPPKRPATHADTASAPPSKRVRVD